MTKELTRDVCRNVAQGLEDFAKLGGDPLHSDRQKLLYKAADLLRAQDQAEADQSAWLIEMPAARWGTGFYWIGMDRFNEWGEIDKAVRFSRKVDAEHVIDLLKPHLKNELEACEHEWVSPSPRATAEQNQAEAGQWIPVSERLPEMDGLLYLVHSGGSYSVANAHKLGFDLETAQGQARWYNFMTRGFGITHWMPLPPSPRATAEQFLVLPRQKSSG